MTLVIVDGPDCSGKSTLVARIQRVLLEQHPDDMHRHFHATPPTSHPLDEYVVPLLGYRPGQQAHSVHDRWHWGEAVYPDVLSRPTRMDPGVWRYTEMFLRSRGAVVVYPQVDPGELLRRHRQRGDDLVSGPALMMADAMYRAVAARSLVTTFRFNAERGVEELDEVARRVVALAAVKEAEAVRLNSLHTYVGPPRPDYLLVGDERPPRMDRDHPAFMPYAPRSGHYLLSALRGPRLTSLGIVNANDVDDVRDAWWQLGQPANVVALGRQAHRRLDVAGVPHSQVPHPQFVRRFYQRHRDEYGTAVAQALAVRTDLHAWRPASPSWSPAR